MGEYQFHLSLEQKFHLRAVELSILISQPSRFAGNTRRLYTAANGHLEK